MQFLGEITRFLDPASMMIVFGGAAVVATMRATSGDARRAFKALGPVFTANPEADALAAVVAVGKVEKLTEIRNIACVDRIKTAERFLRRAVRRLAQAQTADAFARWARHDLAEREHRHQGAIAFWRSVAETAPAMGMIGTVIGLIQMFSALEDLSKIGPAMALAMLTTLYGIILATVVAGPIATRLERLSKSELAWQREALERLLQIAEAELAPVSPPKQRPVLRTVS
jgi:chemotaxis protein MotA